MRYLVTGANGFIGSNLVRQLLQSDETELVVAADIGGCDWQSLDRMLVGVPTVRLAREPLTYTLDGRSTHATFDAVIHLAARGCVPICEANPQEAVASGTTLTARVLEWCHKTNPQARFIFSSSSSVYGGSNDGTVCPRSVYAATKLAAEAFCQAYRSKGLKVDILRLFNVYGPNQRLWGDHVAIVPRAIRAALYNQPMELFDEGQPQRAYCHVDTVCAAIQRLASSVPSPRTATYNFDVGGTQSYSTLHVVSYLQHLCQAKYPDCELKYVLSLSQRAGDVPLSQVNPERALPAGLARVELHEGLSRTLAWYWANRERL